MCLKYLQSYKIKIKIKEKYAYIFYLILFRFVLNSNTPSKETNVANIYDI